MADMLNHHCELRDLSIFDDVKKICISVYIQYTVCALFIF